MEGEREELLRKTSNVLGVLDSQGYHLDQLATIVEVISPSIANELLDVLEGLAQDKQDSSVNMNKNRDLLTKLSSELELQRKQNELLEQEVTQCKKELNKDVLKARMKQKELETNKKESQNSRTKSQKQITALQRRDIQFQHELTKLEKTNAKLNRKVKSLLVGRDALKIHHGAPMYEEVKRSNETEPVDTSQLYEVHALYEKKYKKMEEDKENLKILVKRVDETLQTVLVQNDLSYESLDDTTYNLPVSLSSDHILSNLKRKIHSLTKKEQTTSCCDTLLEQ